MVRRKIPAELLTDQHHGISDLYYQISNLFCITLYNSTSQALTFSIIFYAHFLSRQKYISINNNNNNNKNNNNNNNNNNNMTSLTNIIPPYVKIAGPISKMVLMITRNLKI